MTIPTGGYPKMPFGVDSVTGRTTNLVYSSGQVKQGRYVVFQSASDENAFDSTTAVPASGLTSVQETKHRKES